jgi:L,D-peptidoglycan transpeptidase YkuD (ErfK/YbiS/YcfS/YnhG family)
LVTVDGSGYDTTYATVELWTRQGTCWAAAAGPWTGRIGENGFSDHHQEGDGTTPTGIYGFEQIVYGNEPNPGTRLAYHPLKCGDWWDEDPTSAEYNTFQVVPCGTTPDFGGGSEALWQEPGQYPSFIPIEYNTDPIVKGAGSAIFFHADTGSPTVGCVSVPVADLDFFLRWLNPGSGSRIVMGPARELTDF